MWIVLPRPLTQIQMLGNCRGSKIVPVLVVMGILLVVLGVMSAILAYRHYRKHLPLKQKLKELEDELQGIDSESGATKEKQVNLLQGDSETVGFAETNEVDGLVSIPPTASEYWKVFNKMQETTEEKVWISSLSRVQNDGVYSYYVFRKNQLASKYGVPINNTETLCEIDAWHGTSSLNPDVITSDSHDGFMMNYSEQGLLGRGLYFAERFSYSDCFSHRVNNACFPNKGVRQDGQDRDRVNNACFPNRSAGQDGEDRDRDRVNMTRFPNGGGRQDGEDREIFLVTLLVGQTKEMDLREDEEECRRLVAPPHNPNTNGLRYDTVSAVAADNTKIHAVYENGRAYPSYLIRYYKGARDPSRTPFETEKAMKNDMDSTMTTVSSDMDDDDSEGGSLIRKDARKWTLRGLWNSVLKSLNSESAVSSVAETTTSPVDLETCREANLTEQVALVDIEVEAVEESVSLWMDETDQEQQQAPFS